VHTKCCSENLKGRDHLEDLGIDERIILEFVYRVVRCGLNESGSG